MTLMDILGQYASRRIDQPAPEALQHFEQVADSAPRDMVSHGIAEAFRNDQTPPFPQMVANLFERSNPQQRAGVLNQILASAGPAIIAGMANGPLADMFRRARDGGVTPDQAASVSPTDVRDVAEKAEKQNPNIVDKISDFYSQHPGLVRTLGTAAVTIALAKMAQRQH